MEEKTFSSIFKLPVNNKCLRDLWKMEEKNINKMTKGQVPLTPRALLVPPLPHHLTG